MKAHLLDNLYSLNEEVTKAAANVNNIYNSIDKYKSIRMVYWTEKKSYCGGFLKKVTHYKTTHHSREETIFDSIRFNSDLAVPNAILQEKQHKLNQAKLEAQGEISSVRSIINEYNILQNTNKNLESQIYNIKSGIHIGSMYSLDSTIQSFQNQKSFLELKKQEYEHSAKILPQMIKEKQEYIATKKPENIVLTKELEEEAKVEAKLREGLHKKVSSLDSAERAKLIYKAIADNQQELLNIVKVHGYWSEFAAYIAVAKDNEKVFDYCLAQKMDLDSFIDKDTTLAKYIISSGKKEFIDKLFLSGQELNITAYTALMQKDFAMLELLMKADDKILQKIKHVDASGLSAMQLAIATEDIELIKFIKAHDDKCLEEEFIGYKDALDMALLKENTSVIKEIASGIKNISEYIIEGYKQDNLHHFDLLVQNIVDVKIFFLDLMQQGFTKLAQELIGLKYDELVFAAKQGDSEFTTKFNSLVLIEESQEVISDPNLGVTGNSGDINDI
jgi:hypothetical protein